MEEHFAGKRGGFIDKVKAVVFIEIRVSSKAKKSRSSLTRCTLCLGRDLNPHSHCWKQDFKSCASTNSTTKAACTQF